MANFSNNAITDVGRNLLSHVEMGAVFTPTRIVMGSGSLPAGITPRTIKDVVTLEQTLTINKKKRGNDGTVTIGGVYSNQSVSTGFYFRELALYAKAVYPGGQEIAEVLYSYGNAGSTADYMPAYTSGQPVEREIDLVVYIGNDTEVDLTIESGVYVTQDMLNNALANVGCVEYGQVTIPTEGWEESDDPDFPFCIELPYKGALDTHYADTIVDTRSFQTAYDCGLCPTMETMNSRLKFWSCVIPKTDIHCHIVLFREGSGGEYIMPIASKDKLGGVKIGDGIDVTSDGTISADATVPPENLAQAEDTAAMLDDVFGLPGE